MPNVALFDMAGNKVADTELNDAVFGIEPNKNLMHAMVVCYLANQRQGTQSTLTRTEVSGGGKKPYRQKGTGHARQGSTRSPQFTGGGIVFAPRPRDYSFKMNKKEKRIALKSALTDSVQNDRVIVLDELKLNEIKTKEMIRILGNIKAADKALIVTAEKDDIVVKSARNLAKVVTTEASILNVYDIMNAKTVVLTKDAVAKIEEVYA